MAFYLQQIELIKQVTDNFELFQNSYANTSFNTIFQYDVEENTSVILAFTVSSKEVNGTGFSSFVRHVLISRQAAGAAQIESVPHSSFTQKSNNNFEVNIIPSGNSILFQVKNLNGIETKWQGNAVINKTN